MAKKKFTDKEEKFIEEYLICLNGAEAARRAGYEPANARVIASQNLSKLNIWAEVEKRRDALRKKKEITLEKLVDEAAALAFSEIKQIVKVDDTGVTIYPSDEWDSDAAKAVKKVKKTTTEYGTNVEAEMADKGQNIDRLAALLGFLSDKNPGDNGPHSATVTELLERLREGKSKK